VTLKLANEPTVTVIGAGCKVIAGEVNEEFTSTLKVPLLTLPAESVAVTVTVVLPIGKTDPLT
jgi:hypothetical protein